MIQIFLSYRRDDSKYVTARINDHLLRAFGDESTFIDVDDIPIGSDFPKVLSTTLNQSDVVIIVIGPNWADVRENSNTELRRLHNPNDFVRMEAETALNNPDIVVIPILVMGASMPRTEILPKTMQALTQLHAHTVGDDPDFKRDMITLIEAIKEAAEEEARLRAETVARLKFEQDKERIKNNEKLAELFGFSMEELEANRAGQLTVPQLERVRPSIGGRIWAIVFNALIVLLVFSSIFGCWQIFFVDNVSEWFDTFRITASCFIILGGLWFIAVLMLINSTRKARMPKIRSDQFEIQIVNNKMRFFVGSNHYDVESKNPEELQLFEGEKAIIYHAYSDAYLSSNSKYPFLSMEFEGKSQSDQNES